jgi:hypothetical protein
MHKVIVLPLAGLLALAVAAPASAGANVSNTSGSVTIAQANWESWDDATQTGTYGYVAVSQDASGETFAEYGSSSQQFVQCTGADTPDNPDDDTFGTVGTDSWGYGPASLTITRGMASATASGSLDIGTASYNECTGEYDKDGAESSASFSLDLTATSALIKESGRGSFHIPSEFNGHSSYKSTYRYATGTFDVGGGSQTVDGMIGKVSWTDHANG